jgi:hypothetical protein
MAGRRLVRPWLPRAHRPGECHRQTAEAETGCFTGSGRCGDDSRRLYSRDRLAALPFRQLRYRVGVAIASYAKARSPAWAARRTEGEFLRCGRGRTAVRRQHYSHPTAASSTPKSASSADDLAHAAESAMTRQSIPERGPVNHPPMDDLVRARVVAVALEAGTHWLLGSTSCRDRNPAVAAGLGAGTHRLLGSTSCPDRNPGVERSSPRATPLPCTSWALMPPRRRPPRDERTYSSKALPSETSRRKLDLSLKQPLTLAAHNHYSRPDKSSPVVTKRRGLRPSLPKRSPARWRLSTGRNLCSFGAGGGTRTLKLFRAPAPKAGAYSYFATPARLAILPLCKRRIGRSR